MLRLIALITLAALPATAEEMLFLQPVQTRFGTLTVADTQAEWGDAEQVLLNGAPVQGTLDRFVDVRAVMPRPDGNAADWVLLSLSNGGNGCPMMWTFMELTAQGGQVSDRFGTCSEAEEDYLRTTGRSVGLYLPFLEEGVGFATFYYEGQKATKFATLYDNVSVLVAGAGLDVTRWSGGHPAAPFKNASERNRFATIPSPDQAQNLAARVGLPPVQAMMALVAISGLRGW
jgi:hypothetical protein